MILKCKLYIFVNNSPFFEGWNSNHLSKNLFTLFKDDFERILNKRAIRPSQSDWRFEIVLKLENLQNSKWKGICNIISIIH